MITFVLDRNILIIIKNYEIRIYYNRLLSDRAHFMF